MRLPFILPILAISFAAPALAEAGFETPAPFAYLKDITTNTVLFSKSAQEPMPPASQAKMMSVYVAFSMIKRGDAKLDQMITMQPETWKKWHSQGSTMFLSVNEAVSVENLLHGIVTLSGNDACVVLAEGLGGTEQEYVKAMNEAARKMGLKHSHFTNTNGWPDPDEYVTAEDLAIIAERTIKDFPDLYAKFYGTPNFTWGKTLGKGAPITQDNRNPLLGRVAGADGLKTGHTEQAGYGFTGSAVQDGRRLVMVIGGLTSFNERISQSVAFMNWGFRAWKAVAIVRPGAVLERAEVAGGTADTVGLTAPSEIAALMPRSASAKGLKVVVAYNGPIAAPIAKGQKIAEVRVTGPGIRPIRASLVAAEAVEKAGPFGRLSQGLRRLFTGA
jgi:D-alanyl-D-alanine carboxypeptidase (penicillin-binding protein 5/6)